MKSVNVIASCMAAVCLLQSAASHAQAEPQRTSECSTSNIKQRVSALTDEITSAQLKGDSSAFEKYYADDALIIHGLGLISTKAEDIENLRSGALRYDSYEVHEKTIHAYRDTAVVNLLVSAAGLGYRKPFSGDFRITRVWVSDAGRCKVILFQSTRVTAPAR